MFIIISSLLATIVAAGRAIAKQTICKPELKEIDLSNPNFSPRGPEKFTRYESPKPRRRLKSQEFFAVKVVATGSQDSLGRSMSEVSEASGLELTGNQTQQQDSEESSCNESNDHPHELFDW
eukprot:c20470_g1_i4.p2 GENE.c20470_g1_i4~~c20470_g1_i4.p2  ORF type:complete len:122 (+),score=20.71 c20470_g1_i4:341-706(+)